MTAIVCIYRLATNDRRWPFRHKELRNLAAAFCCSAGSIDTHFPEVGRIWAKISVRITRSKPNVGISHELDRHSGNLRLLHGHQHWVKNVMMCWRRNAQSSMPHVVVAHEISEVASRESLSVAALSTDNSSY